MTTHRKLIEVALPLDAINVASAREKSIRHGHPSMLCLWWRGEDNPTQVPSGLKERRR
jgi:hypothetical protein